MVKRLLLITIMAALPLYGMAVELPVEPREVAIQETLQVQATNYAGELSKIIQSIATSDMPAEAKERAIIVAKEGILALSQQENDRLLSVQKDKGTTIGGVFKIIGTIITVGSSIFLTVWAVK